MSLEPLVVDSIKDRIVRSVWALGAAATRAGLRKAVDCAKSEILELAIDALHRDGYIYVTEAGHFAVVDELADTMPKQAPPRPQPAVANPFVHTIASPPKSLPEGAAMAQEQKHCPACDTTKSRSQFDKGAWRCKPCVANNVPVKPKSNPAAKANGRTKTVAATPPSPPRQTKQLDPVNDELVIPAAGAIRCRVIKNEIGPALAFSIQQGDDQVTCSYEQLQVLRDWATAQLEEGSR